MLIQRFLRGPVANVLLPKCDDADWRSSGVLNGGQMLCEDAVRQLLLNSTISSGRAFWEKTLGFRLGTDPS